MSTNRINDNTRDERIKVIDDAGNVSSTESHADIQEKTIEHGPIEVSPEEIIEKPDQYSEEDLRKTQLTDAEKKQTE